MFYIVSQNCHAFLKLHAGTSYSDVAWSSKFLLAYNWFRVILILSSLLIISAGNLHDFNIFIGSVFTRGNFVSSGYSLCGQKTGQAGAGEWVVITCSSVIGGQYVALQIPGASETLAFCEIAVYMTLGEICTGTLSIYKNIFAISCYHSNKYKI